MASLKTLHPELQPFAEWLVEVARFNGLAPVVTSVYRDTAKQAQLYRDYQAGRSRFPAAPPGRSRHEQRLAFDMTVRPMQMLDALGELWESIGPGFVWGGRFDRRDPIHFEFRTQ